MYSRAARGEATMQLPDVVAKTGLMFVVLLVGAAIGWTTWESSPIILFGSDYWKRLINMDVLIEEGAISPEDLALFQYVDDPQAAWDIIRDFYALPAPAG